MNRFSKSLVLIVAFAASVASATPTAVAPSGSQEAGCMASAYRESPRMVSYLGGGGAPDGPFMSDTAGRSAPLGERAGDPDLSMLLLAAAAVVLFVARRRRSD